MARLLFRYLAIYNNEKLPQIKQIVLKWVHNFAKYQTKLKNISKFLLQWWNFTKSGHSVAYLGVGNYLYICTCFLQF